MMDDSTRQAARQWTLVQPAVSAFVASIVRDFRDRDDVLQEVAVAVIESYANYDGSRPFSAWAIGVARNQIGLYLRKNRREKLVFDQEAIAILAVAFSEAPFDENRRLNFLQDCMKALDPNSRRLCELRYQRELKPAAIADVVGRSANTVAKALQRIREQLRSCIDRKTTLEGVHG
jgi:RNA polymerase sigma-70 factor (ECF subfamily)